MKFLYVTVVALLLSLGGSYPALAQEMFVYPSQNQPPQQMEQDKFTCYGWAKQATGYDPMAAQQSASTAPTSQTGPDGSVVRGAARGALVGVAVGGIAGDAGKGAAIGAASGGLVGGFKRRDRSRASQVRQQQLQQQQANEAKQGRDTYNRAYAACLEGKGYTVK